MKVETRQRLERLAKARQLEYEKVEAQWNELKEKMVGEPEKLIYNALVSQLRAYQVAVERQRSRVGYFLGFMVGDVGLRDIAQEMRDLAERTIDRYGFDVAKEKGLVDEEARVLDFRAKVYGRKNPHYGKPLGEDTHIRSHRVYMICKEAGSEKFELAHLRTDNNALAVAWCELPFYRWVTFPALVQSHDSTGYSLTGSVAKDTRTVFKEVREEQDFFYRVYEQVFRPQLTPIAEVEKYHEATKNAWDRWIIVYGMVDYLGVERETFFGVPGRLLDAELGYEEEHQVRFFVPEHIKLSCGRFSETYLFGRTRRSMYRDQSGKLKPADVVIDVWGLCPNPRLSTAAETVGEAVEEEEKINGFIPL